MGNKKGFTLIEMLVVVLIIGILAGIALPQYRVAVTKAKVASMLPLMRAWKDAYAMWKLQHSEYYEGGNSEYGLPTADDLGVNWPSDWECDNELETVCHNDEWRCYANDEDEEGDISCYYKQLNIKMFQADSSNNCGIKGKTVCMSDYQDDFTTKVCKSMGRVSVCPRIYIIGG